MTLAEVRGGLPFQLISRHVKSHQDEKRDFADLTRPEQLNVLADYRATAAFDELRAARKKKKQSSTHYPPAADELSVAKYARSEPNSLSTSFERTSKNAMTGQTTSMIPSAGGLTGQPVPDSLTVSGYSWSNLVMAGYPSASAKDDAALRLMSALNATKSRPSSICTAARPDHRGAIGF
jgi:hypothetical protein